MKQVIRDFATAQTRLVVADGITGPQLTAPFQELAEELGYQLMFREMDTADDVCLQRQRARDTPDKHAKADGLRNKWLLTERSKWAAKPSYERRSQAALVNELLCLAK